eukprot:CAMPEP_0185575868 /NCGR_PEP_ID=MMETSP0434-20130131/6937_1 /TAXON_ID=626734 ORGANISM="Favella taraikaensis, Strain Fe Narragansett Bay" /NCGR_SAMPLE_ID=MMETSP0434 /ASSEMBLY_ACC=CAM_ASM_000379 /LENGTH=90 /DNA_ID=CAMNT_0028192865 /DNA_START=652 /DNA_END=924 /DNA_ORIENTATION=-
MASEAIQRMIGVVKAASKNSNNVGTPELKPQLKDNRPLATLTVSPSRDSSQLPTIPMSKVKIIKKRVALPKLISKGEEIRYSPSKQKAEE